MLTVIKADLFETRMPIIAHGCNCSGRMGAGVAELIANRHKQALASYERACADGTFTLDKVQMVKCDGIIIANCATQERYGPAREKNASIWAIEACLEKVSKWVNDRGLDGFAIPKIGCGHGGLEWYRDVRPILEKLSAKYPRITIEVRFI